MHFQLQKNARLIEESEGVFCIKSPWVKVKLGKPSLALRQTLITLVKEGGTEDVLGRFILENEQVESLSLFYSYLDLLQYHSLLTFTVCINNKALLSLTPLSHTWKWSEADFNETELFALSPFCFSYPINNEIAIETPLQTACITLKTEEMTQLLYAMDKPTHFEEVCKKLPMYPSSIIKKCLLLLKHAKMLCTFCQNLTKS